DAGGTREKETAARPAAGNAPWWTREGPEPLGQAAARQREGEQRDRGADGEAQGKADPAQAGVGRRGGHGDGGEDRARARHEDRAEGDPEQEAVAAGAEGALR